MPASVCRILLLQAAQCMSDTLMVLMVIVSPAPFAH
jgi:hypothetical protein